MMNWPDLEGRTLLILCLVQILCCILVWQAKLQKYEWYQKNDKCCLTWSFDGGSVKRLTTTATIIVMTAMMRAKYIKWIFPTIVMYHSGLKIAATMTDLYCMHTRLRKLIIVKEKSTDNEYISHIQTGRMFSFFGGIVFDFLFFDQTIF